MLKLGAAEVEFLTRVQRYCEVGLTEPEMAEQEETNLTSLRNRLLRNGFTVDKQVARAVVRTGSGERLSDLLASGALVAAATPAEKVTA